LIRRERFAPAVKDTNVSYTYRRTFDLPSRKEKSMRKNKLNIGTYTLCASAQDEKHVKELAECGTDSVICLDAENEKVLDLLYKYGVGCIVCGRICGEYVSAGKRADIHPAVWGVNVVDEPPATDFPLLGERVEKIKASLPGTLPYINLYPNYGFVAENSPEQIENELKTKTYDEYVKRYVASVDLPYIAFDHYVYSSGKEQKLYDNFRTVADACRESGREMWFTAQVNSSAPDVFISENQLRFQAYSALAYGASAINWACWTKGWWYNNVLDGSGEKTEQYGKLQRVNGELHVFGEEYSKYRVVSTRRICAGFSGTLLGGAKLLGCSDGSAFIVGEAEGREENGRALVILNASDFYGRSRQNAAIKFETDRMPKLFSPGGACRLEKTEGGAYSLEIENCRGAMILF